LVKDRDVEDVPRADHVILGRLRRRAYPQISHQERRQERGPDARRQRVAAALVQASRATTRAADRIGLRRLSVQNVSHIRIRA